MRTLSIFACLFLLQVAHAQTPLEGTNIQRHTDLPHANGYVARQDGVEHLFSAIGAKTGKAMVVSTKAKKRRISGNFDLDQPLQVLRQVSAELGLVWYSDGQSIFIYEAAEQKNAVGRLQSTSLATLNDFLRKARLDDARYPVRGGGADGTFYVAGPPVYVDIVLNAASYLDELYEGADASPGHVEVIALERSFVNGRRYGIRSDETPLPGVADVLARVLGLGDIGTVVSKAPPSSSPSSSVAEPSTDSRAEAEAGGVGDAARTRPQATVQGAVVMAYPETNSLIVRGTLAQIEQVRRLVHELDTERRQIELSLWIIDIKKTELDRLGVNWSGGVRVGGALSIGLNQAGGLSALDGNQFLASVQALTSKGNARIVSRPVLLTQENIPAYFDSNQTFYTQLVGERTTSLESVTYGTLVSVRPRISSRNDIEMQLKIEDGAADRTQGVSNLPIVNRTMIDTVARVPHRLSLLIGGYTRQSNDNAYSGIPGLRRIPWIGRAFGQDSMANERTARVFLIQPRILKPSDALDASGTDDTFGRGIGGEFVDSVKELSDRLGVEK